MDLDLRGSLSGLPLHRHTARMGHQQGDQVFTVGHLQRFDHTLGVAGLVILQQSPLHGLALVGLFDKDRLEGVGIKPGVVHTGADRAGGGIEILHLFRLHVIFVQVFGQKHRILQGTARMAGHQVRHKILLFARLFAQLVEFILEFVENLDGGLAHISQRSGGHMFGGHLQLAGHMVLDQFFKEGVVFLGHQVVEPDAAADEHLFDTGQCAHPAQDIQVIAVIHDQLGAGRRGKTVLAAIAHAILHLLAAAGHTEVGGGAAHIVNVALEVRLVGHPLGLGHNAVGTAAGDPAALMQLNGAEVAAAKAATVLNDGKLHLADGRHAAHLLIHRVIPAGKGQGVDLVQLRAGQRLGGDVLHQIFFALLLHNDLAADHVLIVHLNAAGFCVSHLVGSYLAVTGTLDIFGRQMVKIGQIAGAVHIGDGIDGLPCCQTAGDLGSLPLGHAKADQVGSGILGNRGQHLVQPVIVVGKAAQRSFQTAQDHRQIGISLLCQPGVHGGTAVRPGTGTAAGGIIVHIAGDLGHRIVADHAVHIAASDEKAVFGLAEPLEILAVGKAGLSQNGNLVAFGFQQAADDGGAKAGVIHIGITAHHHKIQLIPAALGHIFPADGQKLGVFGNRSCMFHKIGSCWSRVKS